MMTINSRTGSRKVWVGRRSLTAALAALVVALTGTAAQAQLAHQRPVPQRPDQRQLVLVPAGPQVGGGWGHNQHSHLPQNGLGFQPGFPGFQPGLPVAPIAPVRQPKYLGITVGMTAWGAQINSVVPGSLACRHGLVPGDILMSAHGRPIRSRDDLNRLVTWSAHDVVPMTVWDARRGFVKALSVNFDLGNEFELRSTRPVGPALSR